MPFVLVTRVLFAAATSNFLRIHLAKRWKSHKLLFRYHCMGLMQCGIMMAVIFVCWMTGYHKLNFGPPGHGSILFAWKGWHNVPAVIITIRY